MAQPDRASEQLKDYLAQLSPQVRGRLLAELERLLELGEPIPRTEELIASLRAEFPNGNERRNEAARLFFQPLEPVLVDGAPERANSGGRPTACSSDTRRQSSESACPAARALRPRASRRTRPWWDTS